MACDRLHMHLQWTDGECLGTAPTCILLGLCRTRGQQCGHDSSCRHLCIRTWKWIYIAESNMHLAAVVYSRRWIIYLQYMHEHDEDGEGSGAVNIAAHDMSAGWWTGQPWCQAVGDGHGEINIRDLNNITHMECGGNHMGFPCAIIWSLFITCCYRYYYCSHASLATKFVR